MAQLIKTVNVLNVTDTNPFTIQSMYAYPATTGGIKEAEKIFREWVREAKNEVPEEDMSDYLMDGICEVGEGFIALVHSS